MAGRTTRNKESFKQAPTFVRAHASQSEEEVATIEEEVGNGREPFIWKTRPEDPLRNWEAEPIENVWRLK